MNIFPDNARSAFRNRFDHLPYQLDETWVCGMTDIFYTVSWFNIPSEQHIFIKQGKQLTHPLTLLPNNFETVEKLVASINDIIKEWEKLIDVVKVPVFSVKNGRLHTETEGVINKDKTESKIKVGFSNHLDGILGHSQNRPIYLNEGLTQLNIYCDIINPCLVGDKNVKLLRRVNHDIEKPFGFPMHISFDKPYYHKLSVFNFQEIGINIASENGFPIDFKFGRVSVDLHFKKIK